MEVTRDGAMVNGTGSLRVRVTRVGADSVVTNASQLRRARITAHSAAERSVLAAPAPAASQRTT